MTEPVNRLSDADRKAVDDLMRRLQRDIVLDWVIIIWLFLISIALFITPR